MYLVYIIKSENGCSYIGMTNDFFKRWKQHNRIITGGAKYTIRFNHWTPLCIVDGFKTKSEAMQCEWKLKRAKGYFNRLKNASHLLQFSEKWTSKSPLIHSQNLTIYVVQKYKSLFQNLKTKELVWF